MNYANRLALTYGNMWLFLIGGLYSVSQKKMQTKYNGMPDVECVTNIDNIGMD